MIELKGNMMIDSETGEVYSEDITPKFKEYTYEDYRNDFQHDKSIRFLHPMGAMEVDRELLEDSLNSRNVVAEKKWDGHRALCYVTPKGCRLFSRNVSKQTGWFNENSDQMPHIRDLMFPDLVGTVIDGEVTLPIKNCTCRDVQSVTGSLPERAIESQKSLGLAMLNAYDILYYKGINVQKLPYWRRKILLLLVLNQMNTPFIEFTNIYVTSQAKAILDSHIKNYYKQGYNKIDNLEKYICIVKDYKDLYLNMIREGDEGIILKDMTKPYEQKRSKSFLKMKGHNTYDCVIIGYEEPTAEVDLSERKTKEEDWLYWETYEKDLITTGLPKFWNRDECCPVSKFYAMGWIGAIHIGVYKSFLKDNMSESDKELLANTDESNIKEDDYSYTVLVQVGRCSGLDDKTREEISKNKVKYLGAVVEVEAQKIINKETGSLQHPRFICFRNDKNPEDCTFADHIRRYGEDK